MAEKIKIAELNIDDKALLDSLQKTKVSIQELTDANKKLKDSGEGTSKEFIKNQAELKTLNQEYGRQIKVLQATTTDTNKYTQALGKEVKSVDDAAANNKELRKVRNQLNATTEEGAKKIAEINAKIDNNTDFIKENSSALEKQKQGIGDYTSGIQKARLGAIAFGTALKAAGIGLVIAAVAKLTSVFGQNQKVMDFVNTAARAFSIVMNDIVSFIVDNTGNVVKFFKTAFDDPRAIIKDLGDKIKANLIERFESMLETVGFLGSAVKKFFSGDFTGALDDAKEAGKEFVDVLTGTDDSLTKMGDAISGVASAMSNYGEEVLKTAQAQIALENSTALAEAQNRRLIEQYDRQAEQLRQIRDDETKTFAERIAANDKLADTLNEQERLMTANAELAVRNAANNVALNNTIENQVALSEALAEKEGILAQIEGFRSEQIINRIALNKEEAESEQEKVDRITEIKDQFLLDEQERELAKLERETEAHLLELETLELREDEKAALLLAIEEDKLTQIADINTKYREDDAKEDTKLQKDKVARREATLDAIIGLVDAETGIGKAAIIAKQLLAIKEQAIDLGLFTSKASLKAGEAGVDIAAGTAKSAAAAPFPANLPLIAGFIASVAGVFGAIKSATNKGKAGIQKFARGGILQGASHAQGGIQTPYGEVEGGEAVINKRSTGLFRPILSRINQAGGGKKFANGGILGSTDSSSNSFINYDLLASKVAEANMALPAPQVAVNEIREVGNNVDVIESNSRF